jgi:serine/threonine protein kinase
MLTPDYASPEQVAGGPITMASDIYSLGAVLYKLLTGASPHAFGGHSVGAIVAAISTGRITPPSKLAPGLKDDLETVLLKALRREPRERYASVEQFSEDLENYLKSRPIRACKGHGWFRTRRFLRHSRTPVAAVTLAMTGLSAGALEATHHGTTAQRRFNGVRQQSGALSETRPTGLPLGST